MREAVNDRISFVWDNNEVVKIMSTRGGIMMLFFWRDSVRGKQLRWDLPLQLTDVNPGYF